VHDAAIVARGRAHDQPRTLRAVEELAERALRERKRGHEFADGDVPSSSGMRLDGEQQEVLPRCQRVAANDPVGPRMEAPEREPKSRRPLHVRWVGVL